MGSVPGSKHDEAVALVRQHRFGSDKARDEARRALASLCAAEISEGLRDGGGVLAWSTRQQIDKALRYVAFTGVQKALDTAADVRPPDLPTYVRACIAEVVAKTRAQQEAEIEALTPQSIYDMVLKLPRDAAASLLDRLSFDQRTGLITLIKQRVDTGPSTVVLDLGKEPEDYRLWPAWYAARLHMLEPSVRRLAERDPSTPTNFLLDPSGELGPQPKNKQGEPINLAGPLLVKVCDVLTGLPNNRIPAPARSNTRLGRTFGVDAGVIARWRRHPEWGNLRVNIEHDGKGGVHYTFDLDAMLRSARIVVGKKRGSTAAL